jgi:phosphoserine/homoserine phosphotransferase
MIGNQRMRRFVHRSRDSKATSAPKRKEKLACLPAKEGSGAAQRQVHGPLCLDKGRGVLEACRAVQQSLVTLDMEGVLTPEIWIAVAERTGIDGLRRTTRDEPDYDVLMRGRLALLRKHGLGLRAIQEVIGELAPLPGAVEFLRTLRELAPVVILSDTFEQFAAPLVRQLGYPLLLCHRLVVEGDRIVDYQLRLPDQKRAAVTAFRSLNYRVIAAGDSYNDTTMLREADAGFLFRAPRTVQEEFPQFPACETYDALLAAIQKAVVTGNE